jgi:hypothetical protein
MCLRVHLSVVLAVPPLQESVAVCPVPSVWNGVLKLPALIVSLSLLAVGTAATKQAGGQTRPSVLPERGGVNESLSDDHGQQMSPLPSLDNDRARRTSASTSPPAGSTDPVTYWHSLAVKRLHLLGKRERRIVHLLGVVHKLRGGSSSGRIAHLAGWLCIHNGAYPGAPHEGRGRNGPYSGPLQMTSPWMGHYPPGGSWDNLSDSAVYAIAESVAAGQHFSYSFMRGQWPNTYPPCASRF